YKPMNSEPINTVTLSGEVLEKPETDTSGELPVCRLYLRLGSSEEEPSVKVVFFGEKADICQGLSPGDSLALVGKLVLRPRGRGRPEVEVQGRNAVLLSRKGSSGKEATPKA
ncbi:MAG: single-stranded DNA-binding protein, partial [Nitrospinota bacterium]